MAATHDKYLRGVRRFERRPFDRRPRPTNVWSARRLYKYLPPERIDVITSGLIRFTPPGEFNDPFDSLTAVHAPFGHDRDLNDIGVLSLSAIADDVAMWAHYARDHTGFVIGFDATNSFLASKRGHRLPPWITRRTAKVHYVSSVLRLHALRRVHLWKAWRWHDEAEWRAFARLSQADRVIKQSSGEAVHLFKFPEEALAEIIVGARAPKSLKATLSAWVGTRCGGPELLKCAVNAGDMRLEMREMKRGRAVWD